MSTQNYFDYSGHVEKTRIFFNTLFITSDVKALKDFFNKISRAHFKDNVSKLTIKITGLLGKIGRFLENLSTRPYKICASLCTGTPIPSHMADEMQMQTIVFCLNIFSISYFFVLLCSFFEQRYAVFQKGCGSGHPK